MRALSLRQPWGWAITDIEEPQAKRLENRVWRQLLSGKSPIPPNTDFAIHVSATKPGEWDVDSVMSSLDLDVMPPEAVLPSAITGVGQIAMVLRCKEEQRNLPKRQFDALRESGGPWELDPQDRDKFLFDLPLTLSQAERHEQIRRWWLGPFAFVLAKVRKLNPPILGVKGSLSFWEVPPEIEAQIKERL